MIYLKHEKQTNKNNESKAQRKAFILKGLLNLSLIGWNPAAEAFKKFSLHQTEERF